MSGVAGSVSFAAELRAGGSLPGRPAGAVADVTPLVRVSAVPMVETRSGVEHVDEILGVDGVDGVFIGPYDLSLSLGQDSVLAGAVMSAIESVIERTRERGRITGIFTGNPSLAERLPPVDLLGVDTDATALRAGLKLLFGPAVGGR